MLQITIGALLTTSPNAAFILFALADDKSGWKADITAACSIAIAVVSVIVAVVSLEFSRRSAAKLLKFTQDSEEKQAKYARDTLSIQNRHNRLSAEPILTDTYLYIDSMARGFTLKNAGLGPAIIRTITIIYEDEEFSTVSDVLNEATNGHTNGDMYEGMCDWIGKKGAVIPAGETVVLVDIGEYALKLFKETQDNNIKTEIHFLSEIIKKLTWVVEYQSIYKERVFNLTVSFQ
ncbi:MAG: hypothetical protein HRT88_16050 [Lentisphaeraceae bacterium]|nr:hypothetical protein [Lentisphaeraceae bacterium]